jgi:amphiphysin
MADRLQEYQLADHQLKTRMIPILSAIDSLLPHLLGTAILIQNTLLGQNYTALHNYCEASGFPSPPPSMADVVNTWGGQYRPVQKRLESELAIVSGKKLARQPKVREDATHGPPPSINTPDHGRSPYEHSAGQRSASASPARSPLARTPPVGCGTEPLSWLPPGAGVGGSLRASSPSTPRSVTPSSPSPGALLTPHSAHIDSGPNTDYFSGRRVPSSSSLHSAASIAKKKPPPPPPPKRSASSQSLWVTALYDFAGQSQGDLCFQEGDRIKVIKKTESTNDWWEGELKGVQGFFPANYCQAV